MHLFPRVAVEQQRITPSSVIKPSLLLLAFICLIAGFRAEASATTLFVAGGGDFQAALDAAQPGDTIVLTAGATYVGPFTLPFKDGATDITIQSSALAQLPGADTRVTPEAAPLLPKLVSPGRAEPVLRTSPGAHHFRFVGVEFAPIDPSAFLYDLIQLGGGSESQFALAQVPHHLTFDRCYIHAYPTQELKRAFALNSASTDILNSYVAGFKVVGQDSQAICGWNGPGPYRIINNYLEAAGENVLFGGADPAIPDLVPSDIEIRRNHFSKPREWRVGDAAYSGVRWTVKNLLELKNAQRVVIDGNVLEHNWDDAQNGFAVVFTPRNQEGTAPWSVVRDVRFTNNILRHTGSAINVTGRDNNNPSRQTAGIRITNNWFYDIDGARWGGAGTLLQLSEVADVLFEHNTALNAGNAITTYGAITTGFVFRNNLLPINGYGIKGDGYNSGTHTIDAFFPGGIFAHNVLAGAPPMWYPANNFYPLSLSEVGFVDAAGANYRLAAGSPYRLAGTDARDVGCDFDALYAASTAAGSLPTPTPTPSPSPAPSGWQDVQWTNLQNSEVNDSVLKKTAGCEGCYDAVAVSRQNILSGDAYLEFTAHETTTNRMVGLGNVTHGSDYNTIDFSIYLTRAEYAEVRERGGYRRDTRYRSGDVFRITVEANTVRYYKNGKLFYTSAAAPSYPLAVNAALSNLHATISEAVILLPSRHASPKRPRPPRPRRVVPSITRSDGPPK